MRYLPGDVPWLDQRHVRMCIEDGSFLWSVVSLIQAARYLGPIRGEFLYACMHVHRISPIYCGCLMSIHSLGFSRICIYVQRLAGR